MKVSTKHQRPVIGITSSHEKDDKLFVRQAYTDAISKAGGIPFIIPVTDNSGALQDILANLDGLLITGGDDINPAFYNERPIGPLNDIDIQNDNFNLAIIRMAYNINMPILGICRGEQVINVAFKGSLYQDIPTQVSSKIRHNKIDDNTKSIHSVSIAKNSRLYKIIGTDNLKVNSSHHQSIKQVADNLRIVALASDNVVESVESIDNNNIIAVQWHPECMSEESATCIFNEFINRAAIYKTKTHSVA